MGEVKHTQGPWRASRYQGRRSGEYNYLIDSGGVAVLAEVFARDAMNTALDSASNACLIAAAPDLLEALKLARSCIQVPHIVRRSAHDDYIREQVAKIDAAIAKAEPTNA